MGYVKEGGLAGKRIRELMSDFQSKGVPLKQAFKEADFSGKTALILSSWFGVGLMPIAPGSFGTLAALPPVIIVNYLGVVCSTISLIILIPLALWSSHISQKILGENDPSDVVIDEALGLLITVFLLPLSWLTIILGFLLFRFFDILKPFPIGAIDKKVKGSVGIVLDDIVAGIYANICVRIVQVLLG